MRETVKLVLIGIIMGAAEVVPGVSGGTIAFISGIYERLVNALRQCTPYLLVVWKNHGFLRIWQRVDATFLLTLFAAMGASVVLLAGAVGHLLRHEPVGIWSFFFGLVIASVWIMYRQISRKGVDILFALAAGGVFGALITTLVPINLEPTPLYIFLGGAVAVCAWILPGLSGSFILLVLGLYAFVIDAIERFDFVILGALGAGCALGLVSFAQVLSRLFRYYRDQTLAVLTGFMVGSLTKLWPWKQTLSYQLRTDGEQIPLVQEPVLPTTYLALTGQDPQYVVAVLAAMVGLGVVLTIHWLASDSEQHRPE